MHEVPYVQRNNVLAFAENMRQNLELTERFLNDDSNFHPVTQLINSLLGLVVFLKEKHFDSGIAHLGLNDLGNRGWPEIEMSGEECKSLGRLVYHLRNAAAHGRMKFSSDSHQLAEVIVRVEDWKTNQTAPYWSAKFTAAQLRDFCYRLIDLVEQTIG